MNLENEQIKRKYFRWLEQAEGNCRSTIDIVEKAIQSYQTYSNNANFKTFNSDKAIEFKEWMKKKEYKGKLICISTVFQYVRHLRKFFTWLYGQPGYKSKIDPNDVTFLRLKEKEDRVAKQSGIRKFPSLENVIKVVRSITGETEIDKRDRCLISFTALTGMRDSAIISLPIECIDLETMMITQDPKLGVQTKFSKWISSKIFPFDESLLNSVLEWHDLLMSKRFNPNDPFFPRNKANKGESNLSFEKSKFIEPIFWNDAGSIRKIFKERFKNVGLNYYPPHTFRHLAISLALKLCKNGQHLKAISQNFGHENVITMLTSYSNYEPEKISEILSELNCTQNSATEDDILLQIKKLVANVNF